jgi:hypothetical protein
MSRDEVLRELNERRVRREADAREADVRRALGPIGVERLATAWREAQHEANDAYATWCEIAGADSYTVYRAAQDRADEAQDALWQEHILSETAPGYEGWITS